MAKFLHGVEVLEIDTGPRPIQTVRSGVIGIVGTAPDAEGATPAEVTIGNSAANTGIVYTATEAGTSGNNLRIRYVDPGTASATLEAALSGDDITVTLATDAEGAVNSTASEVLAAVNGITETPVSASLLEGSDGSGVVRARDFVSLSGGAEEPFPINRPSLVAGSRSEAARLGTSGTLPAAMDGIFDQIGAVVIVVRVEEGADD